jgi:hypothetical protein
MGIKQFNDDFIHHFEIGSCAPPLPKHSFPGLRELTSPSATVQNTSITKKSKSSILLKVGK